METKNCKVCGRELPLTMFANNNHGTPLATCRDCVAEKKRTTRYNRAQFVGGVKPLPFPIPTSTARPSATYGVRCAVLRSGLKAVGV